MSFKRESDNKEQNTAFVSMYLCLYQDMSITKKLRIVESQKYKLQTNLLLLSLTNLHWPGAANLPGYFVASLNGVRLLEVYVFCFAAALGVLKALVNNESL